MHIIIGGGYHEHGRTCFLAEGAGCSFLLDCGLMEGAASPYPRLAPEQLSKTKFLFLSHAHADHAGALPWLFQSGFRGKVFLSRATWEQLSFRPERSVFLEDCGGEAGSGLSFSWGKSGHCPGSVWYRFSLGAETLLYSGDYVEDTLVYLCEPIRGQRADIAILDCAYLSDPHTAAQNREAVRLFCGQSARSGLPLLLPVPRYGRGLELLSLIGSLEEAAPVYAGEALLAQLRNAAAWRSWRKPSAEAALSRVRAFPTERWLPGSGGFLLVCDPQLSREENRMLCSRVLGARGRILLTGNQDAGSFSGQLLREQAAVFLRYPAHQNKGDLERLAVENTFGGIIPFHCKLDGAFP